MNTNTPFKSFETKADKEGYWEYRLDVKSVEQGNYLVETQDPDGNRIDKSIFVSRETTTTEGAPSTGSSIQKFFSRENTSELVYLSCIAVLFLAILFLTWKIYGPKERSKKIILKKKKIGGLVQVQKTERYLANIFKNIFQKKYFIPVTLFLIIAVSITLFSMRYIDNKNTPRIVDIQGSIINPLSNQGYTGVDLSAGNTVIKTSDSGAYNFNRISNAEGIKITFPTLLRALRKDIGEDGSSTIYFNPEMYNTLISVIDLESRGKFDKVYLFLYQKAKEKISSDKFVKEYKTIFSIDDVNNQELRIGKEEIIAKWNSRKYDFYLNQVVAIEVINRGKSETFYLIYDNSQWWIIK